MALGAEVLDKKNMLNGTGGWINMLNKAIKDFVDLSVVFHYPYKKESFIHQNTKYFPVFTGNILLENLKMRFLGKVYDEDFLSQYLNIIEKVKPDIIHIHGTENPYLCIFGKTKVPVVVSIQGNLTVCYHKFLSGLHDKYLSKKPGYVNMSTILLGRDTFRRRYNNLKKMAVIEQGRLKYAKNVIGRTDWDKRITRVLAPNSRYFIINEILRDVFYDAKWNKRINKGKIVLFTTNSNKYYKGFETICHALHLLNSLKIDVEWRVAGISKVSLINKITKKELGRNYPSKGLVLLGSLSENELIKNLLNSHIYVMPSHIENSPNNLCEAMILGMPCISTFAGGAGSLLKDGEEGILIQDGDPWAMAGAIMEFINNFDKAVNYGRKAREKALIRHSKEIILNDLIKLYGSIIHEN